MRGADFYLKRIHKLIAINDVRQKSQNCECEGCPGGRRITKITPHAEKVKHTSMMMKRKKRSLTLRLNPALQ